MYIYKNIQTMRERERDTNSDQLLFEDPILCSLEPGDASFDQISSKSTNIAQEETRTFHEPTHEA